MPKNKKNKKNKTKSDPKQRSIEFAESETQEYAKIIKCLGDRKVTVILPDKKEVMGIIPGRFRKRVWMSCGDVVLISRRDFQTNKVDIIHKYYLEEIRFLCAQGEIPIFFLDADNQTEDNEDVMFDSDSDSDTGDINIDNI